MKSENIKIEKKVIADMERAYELTMSDIKRYIRLAGSITIEVVKRLIRWNYFENKDAVDFHSYQVKGVNNIIVTIDMFDLQLWLAETYGMDSDMLDDIEEELNYLSTFNITP